MSPLPDGSADFVSLTVVHAALFDEFIAHQVALLHRDFDAARARLASFRARLERHIDAEEELFDAVFARTGDVARADNPIGRVPVDLFTGEHKHFRELLADFTRAAARLDAADADVDQGILDLLDDEATFKTFFRHHDEREKNLLYPALDEHVPAARRAEILDQFRARAPD